MQWSRYVEFEEYSGLVPPSSSTRRPTPNPNPGHIHIHPSAGGILTTGPAQPAQLHITTAARVPPLGPEDAPQRTISVHHHLSPSMDGIMTRPNTSGHQPARQQGLKPAGHANNRQVGETKYHQPSLGQAASQDPEPVMTWMMTNPAPEPEPAPAPADRDPKGQEKPRHAPIKHLSNSTQ
ncbi:hypothetical protein CSOJ01_11196 [Colletotrichum sojae]|uniref:Uncharacterized protein n=1 Tax=Colletotrichum sojae TaxID=2175907 RepID=A0A8H6MN81_9PEZI|nr:hypothetical protein CSOJ01_11196 [Colletotrichum sojae]